MANGTFNYNLGYNFNSDIFTASIDGEGIIYQEQNGAKIPIGVDNQTAKEMQETIDNYYAKLVEVGVIIPEKTPEEIAEEQMKINQSLMQNQQALMEMIGELKDKIGGMENASTEVDIEPVGQNDKPKPGGNSASNKPRGKDDTRRAKKS